MTTHLASRSVRDATRGFSLVEVVLALGVISIAIVSLLGLLAASTSSSRFSDEDTSIAAITRQVDTELRNRTIATLPLGKSTWYFDNEAKHLLGFDNAANPPTDAIYRCEINLNPDTTFDSTTAVNGSKNNLYRVIVDVSYAQRPIVNTGPDPKAYVLKTLNSALYRND